MPDENLLKYIRNGLAQGRTEDILRPMLASAGWAQKDVDDAFVFVASGQMPAAPAAPARPTPIVQQQPNPSPAPSEAPVVAQPLAPSDTASLSPMRFLNGKFAGLVIFIVCLVGVGTALAYYYAQPSLSPDQVLNKTIVAMQNVKTYSFVINGTSTIQVPTSSLALVGSDAGNGALFLSGSATGSMDMSDLTKLKELFNLNISASTGTKPAFTGAIQYVALDNVYYVKIDSADLGGGTASSPNPFSSMMQFFIGSWFKIDVAELQKTFGASLGTSTLSGIQSSTQLSAAKIQQIKDIAAQYPIFAVDKTLPGETISGQDTYHYSLSLNKNNLATVLGKVSPIVSGQSLSDEQIASATAAFNDITVKDFEIWIGKKDFLVYKLAGDIAIAQDQGGPADDVQLSDVNSGYNKPVTIVAPEGAKDVVQILSGFMGGFSGSVAVPLKTSK